MKTREKVGADIPNRFDYQLALSMLYLIDSNEPITIIIETLEDFAIVRNINDKDIVDIYQVKTVNSGLITKTTLINEDVYGKLYLTDNYFDCGANTLNIISNCNLKGKETEKFDKFKIIDKFTKEETNQIYNNIEKYFKSNNIPYVKNEIDSNKLVFVKTNLPLKDTLFEKTLIGSVNEILNKNLFDQSINPTIVFKTLKDYFVKVRNTSIENEISFEDAKHKRGISSDILKMLLDSARQSLSLNKSQILTICDKFLTTSEIIRVKSEYSNFVARSNDLGDNVFIKFKKKLYEDFEAFIKMNSQLIAADAIKLFINQYPESTYSKEFIIICLITHIYC